MTAAAGSATARPRSSGTLAGCLRTEAIETATSSSTPYAFLRAVESGATPGPRLQPIVEAALEAEQMVLADPRPSCVIRVGYLYGPGSSDLKLYRLAFWMGRPYWAGPRKALHDHVHHADAARALL